MPDITPRINLVQQLPEELWDPAVNYDNFAAIDKVVGVTYCTSSTRPTTELFPGRIIKETDTGLKFIRNATNTEWELDSSAGSIEGASEIENRPNTTSISGPFGVRLTIPTHVSPAGGQTTHPSVAYIPEDWNGYAYWMAHTPYPGGNDDHEDPNISTSWDGFAWVNPVGLTNPIDNQLGTPIYNSDVDLRMGPGNKLYLFWRTYNQDDTGQEERLYYSTSSDGITWSAKVNFYTSNQSVIRLLSPSLLFENGTWTMWAVNIVPSPNTVVKLTSLGSTPESGWSAPVVASMGAMQGGKEPWHISIIKDENMYVGLLNDCTTDSSGVAGDLLFITSNEGNNFENSGSTVIPRTQAGEHDNLYRASLIPAYDGGARGYRVWYSAYLAGAPNVWNIYRTFITAAKKPPGGTVAFPIVTAGSTSTVAVSFPAGTFKTTPSVWLTVGSTRLTPAAINITTTGFDAQVTNWTAASASASTARWGAIHL